MYSVQSPAIFCEENRIFAEKAVYIVYGLAICAGLRRDELGQLNQTVYIHTPTTNQPTINRRQEKFRYRVFQKSLPEPSSSGAA